MKIFYPKDHYNKEYRGQLFPLLKPFIKQVDYSDQDRLKTYHLSIQEYDFVESVRLTDIVILPMSWNYYVKTQQVSKAKKLIELAAIYGKTVWSWNAGDLGVKVPAYNNLKVFRMGGYVSKNQSGHLGIPSFVGDYLSKKNIVKSYLFNEYSQKPVVGFCGQANASLLNASKEQLKIGIRNLKSTLRLSANEPQAILSSTRLRAQLLQCLSTSNLINDQFIIRRHYRAGAKTKKERDKSTQEFYLNIRASQYVLCVRGAGNFSVRFYETLMMGRIPVYVHTDGFLPLSSKINWKKHVVWIEYKDRYKIAEIVAKFHQKLDKKGLLALQVSNRELWKSKLTLGGFFRNQNFY